MLGQSREKKSISNCTITKNKTIIGKNTTVGINIRSGKNNKIFDNSFENRTNKKIQLIREDDKFDKSEKNQIHSNSEKKDNILRKQNEE